MVGSGSDAGKVALAVDATTGPFLAKRQKSGAYLIAVNRQSADGRFSLSFSAFSRKGLEVIRPANGQPVMTAIQVDAAMLEAE